MNILAKIDLNSACPFIIVGNCGMAGGTEKEIKYAILFKIASTLQIK